MLSGVPRRTEADGTTPSWNRETFEKAGDATEVLSQRASAQFGPSTHWRTRHVDPSRLHAGNHFAKCEQLGVKLPGCCCKFSVA